MTFQTLCIFRTGYKVRSTMIVELTDVSAHNPFFYVSLGKNKQTTDIVSMQQTEIVNVFEPFLSKKF